MTRHGIKLRGRRVRVLRLLGDFPVDGYRFKRQRFFRPLSKDVGRYRGAAPLVRPEASSSEPKKHMWRDRVPKFFPRAALNRSSRSQGQ